MFITDLPVETVSQILSNVSNRYDMFECTKVCKLWRKEMVPVYYRDIVIQRNHEQYLSKVQTEINENGDRIGDFVGTLTFGEELESLLSQENFELLIHTMPFLRAIRLDQASIDQTLQYLQYLQEMSSCTQLEEVSIVGYFSYDDLAYYENICHLYHSVNYQLKHQITTLSIFEANAKFLDKDRGILDYIKGFTSLKHFTLQDANGFSANVYLDLTSMLDVCCGDLCSLIIDVDLGNPIYAPGIHKYHLNLTSLNLSIPSSSIDLLSYLVEYVPNLKELDIREGKVLDILVSDLYASLPPDMYFKFNCYFKQLRRFHYISIAQPEWSIRDLSWRTIKGIYNNQKFCNLRIHFYTKHCYYVNYIDEKTSFDQKTFLIYTDFITEQFDEIQGCRLDFFLNLNSIHVSYLKEQVDEGQPQPDNRQMSDLFAFATSQQRTQLHLIMDDEVLILSAQPLKSSTEFVFPQGWSSVQYTLWEKVKIDEILLNNITTLYPTIKNIQMLNCNIQMQDEDTNHYIVDLQQFKELEELVFDFDEILQEHNQIVFQWTNGDLLEKNYIYNASISDTAMYSMNSTEVISKDGHVIKFRTANLQTLLFQRESINVEIINT